MIYTYLIYHTVLYMGISIAYACIFHIYYIEGEGANPTTWREKKRRAWILPLPLSLSHTYSRIQAYTHMCAIDSWVQCGCVRVSDLKLLAAPTGVVSMDEMLDLTPLYAHGTRHRCGPFLPVCVCFLAFHLIGLLEWPQIAKKKTPSHSQRLTQTLTQTHTHSRSSQNALLGYFKFREPQQLPINAIDR